MGQKSKMKIFMLWLGTGQVKNKKTQFGAQGLLCKKIFTFEFMFGFYDINYPRKKNYVSATPFLEFFWISNGNIG